MQLQETIDSGDFGGDDLALIIEQDQVLATHLIKVANSAFYAGLNPSKTVKEASFRLGTDTLVGIAHMVSQKKMYETRLDSLDQYMTVLWKHALCVGLAAKWFAINLGFPQIAEEACMAGLLHDIGKLIQLRIIDELLYRKIVNKTQLSSALIRELIETLHAKHGRIYLEKQRMPKIYILTAATHHNKKISTQSLVLNFVLLANKVCHKLGIGLKKQPDIMLSTTPEATTLMVKDIAIAELLVTIEEHMESINAAI